MSIQQCYENFFSDQQTNLNNFKIFSHLTRLGYICRRSSSTRDTLSIENNKKNTECEVAEADPISPIIKRSEHRTISKSEVFDRLNNFMPKTVDENFLLKMRNKLGKNEGNFHQMYDVFLPNKSFKKSNMKNVPNYKLYIEKNNKNDEQNRFKMPNFFDLISMSNQASNLFAFVNESNGADISYYKFNTNQKLPSVF